MKSLPKVELHLHLDGAFRCETIFELGKAKDTPSLRSYATAADLQAALLCEKEADLGHVLKDFQIFMPAVIGDVTAIERLAYELCEDKARDGVIYFEARHCPQLLANTIQNNPNLNGSEKPFSGKGRVTEEDVVVAVGKGLRRGSEAFGVDCRQILAGIRGFPDWADEILRLAVEHKDLDSAGGVVGVDLAGSHATAAETCDEAYKRMFQGAVEAGVHRTVHAGESGTAAFVVQAVRELSAERIGHGYHVVDEAEAFEEIRREKIHLEGCPLSSLITGAVAGWEDHPMASYAAMKADFGISTDDPLLFGNSLSQELCLAQRKLGFDHTTLWQCQLNAAKACFASEATKEKLVERILAANPLLDL